MSSERMEEIRQQLRHGRPRRVDDSDDINMLIHEALEAQLAPWTHNHLKGTDEERKDALRQLDHGIKISGIRQVILQVLLTVENLHATQDCELNMPMGEHCDCGMEAAVALFVKRRQKLGFATDAEIRATLEQL